MIKSYKDLIVWQKSIELVKEIYRITEMLPKSEIYALISQMRRAAISVSSNIAEGYGRRSLKEYVQFYSIAYGSALELETQLLISKELQFITEKDFVRCENLLIEVLKMLHSMLYTMNSKLTKRSKTY